MPRFCCIMEITCNNKIYMCTVYKHIVQSLYVSIWVNEIKTKKTIILLHHWHVQEKKEETRTVLPYAWNVTYINLIKHSDHYNYDLQVCKLQKETFYMLKKECIFNHTVQFFNFLFIDVHCSAYLCVTLASCNM